MEALAIIVVIVSFILAVMIVNKGQQLYMRLIGADTMFFSARKKWIAIFIVCVIIAGLLTQVLGIA